VKEALHSRGLKSETKPSVEMEDDFFLKITDMYGQEEVNAIRSNDVESLRKLSADGTNLECGNRFGETIIHLACRRSHRDLLKFLIDDVGVSVRVCDDYGRTPMHDACWRAEPDLELLDMLIDRAPELLMLSDKRGHTPLDYARREHWSVLVPFLLERTAKFQPV
jgi:ankyrin repeat protein